MPVVPNTGTWIEMSLFLEHSGFNLVVPNTGTWIEITVRNEEGKLEESFPTRERGLK